MKLKEYSNLFTDQELKECLLLLEEWKQIIDSKTVCCTLIDKKDRQEQELEKKETQFFMYE